MQLHARSPWDIRKLYRRSHPLIPKALGIFGSVGTRLHRLTGDPTDATQALEALQTLVDDTTAGPDAWGYHWDMQTRWSFYPAGSPNVVVTAFAAAGLNDAAKGLDRPDFAERARRSAEWVRDSLFLEREGFFVYHPGSEVNIHNANLLGAWTVHQFLGHDAAAGEMVQRALERTLAAQRADGAWGYGEGESLGWVDSFHTGYVLACLARMVDLDDRIPDALARGSRYYERFFDGQGRAMLWAHKRHPEDAHAAGTAMTTLALLEPLGHVRRELLKRGARRVLEANVQDGHAVYRRYRMLRTTVKYLRWADAHVALGLADAAVLLNEPHE